MACLFQSLADLYRGMHKDQELRREVVLIAFVNALAIVLVTFAYKWWRHPLYGQNKGPRIYPIIGSVIVYLRNRHRLLEFNTDILSKIPGHTARYVRPGLEVIVTANPANVEHILKTNFDNYPKGEMFNRNFRQLLGTGIFNADGDLWRIQRKVASYEFTTRSLRDIVLELAARETCSRLVPVLLQASESGQVLDLQDIFARFAFDSICQLAFGVDPACLASSLPRVKFAEAFDEATLLSLQRAQAFSRQWWTFQEVLNIGRPKALKAAVRVIDEFAVDVIQKRRQELALAAARGVKEPFGGRDDLLSRFMTVVDSDSTLSTDCERTWMEEHQGEEISHHNTFSDIFLRDMVTDFVLAGRDTTTSAMSWFFWLLSHHPAVVSAIRDEISSLLSCRNAEGGSAPDEFCSFTFEELKKMHYLHASLTESMRLHPPVPADLKTARKADVFPDGTAVPAGASVIYHIRAMGRMEDLWGKDCLDFKPERWLKDGVFVPQSLYKYTVFQAGPRVCLGKDMVMLQMKLTCAAILHNFDIVVARDYQARYLSTVTMRIKDGLPVTVRRRTT